MEQQKHGTKAKAKDMMSALVSASQPAPAAGFLAIAATVSLSAASASARRSGRCDLLRMKLTGPERRPWLLPLSDPANDKFSCSEKTVTALVVPQRH